MSKSRHRIVVALIVIGSLLFQQVAVAAYACDPAARASSSPSASHCEHSAKAPGAKASPLCEKHCTPDLTVLTDSGALSAPSFVLPPVVFALVVHEPAASFTHAAAVPLARSDPPPRLRYCSLLI